MTTLDVRLQQIQNGVKGSISQSALEAANCVLNYATLQMRCTELCSKNSLGRDYTDDFFYLIRGSFRELAKMGVRRPWGTYGIKELFLALKENKKSLCRDKIVAIQRFDSEYESLHEEFGPLCDGIGCE
jgi:hypothetical protein